MEVIERMEGMEGMEGTGIGTVQRCARATATPEV